MLTRTLEPAAAWVANLENRKLRNQIYALKDLIRAHPRPILIYQMAKVGSTTVYQSLRAAGLTPLHVHHIRERIPDEERAWHVRQGQVPTIDVFVGRLLAPYLRWTSHRLKAISLVRDPVARYLSKLYHVPGGYDIVSGDIDETVQAVQDRLARPEVLEEGMFSWFDREIKARLDVDIMAQPFDRERGYTRYQGPRADVLVLKLERLSDLLPTVVSDFVGTPLQEVRANVGQRKASGDAYQRAKAAFRLPEATAAWIYDHAWVRHFYTADERAAFRAKWAAARSHV